MELLIRVSETLDRVITKIGKIAAWAGLALIVVTIFDVVTRRFLVLGSTKLQDAEWHLHVVLFAFCLGFAYLKDSHVRIDLLREQLKERTQWWIEVIGILVFLLPFCILIIWFGIDFVHRAYDTNEVSASATGLSHRWMIKAVIPLGFTVLALSGIAILLRKIVELFGPPELRRRIHNIEDVEADHIEDMVPDEIRPQDGGIRNGEPR